MTRLTAPFFAPDAVDTPYWWQAARPQPRAGVASPSRTDIAIIGGGFTGLSAALTLARAGREVTVFEAEEPGWGASSRNGGMLGPGWGYYGTALAYGPEKARAIVEEFILALCHVQALVAREAIECDLKVVGHFRGAMTPRIYDMMGRDLGRLRKAMPTDCVMIPRTEQRGEIGSDLYHGGFLNPGHAGLHPGKYVRGLAHAVERAGARIVTGARVEDLCRAGGGFAFTTAGGRTEARQVLVATNAYTGPLVPFVQRRIIPIRSAMIATEPLRTDLMDRLMPKRRMLGGSQRIVTYFRPSPDGSRILFGGRVLKLGDGAVQNANAGHLRKQMLQVFPELEHTPITHYWHGQTAFTFDKLPHLGEADGLFYSAGYCGTGVSRATWLGHKIAERMIGETRSPSAYEDLPFRTRALYRGSPWFLPLALLFYEARDRWDQR